MNSICYIIFYNILFVGELPVVNICFGIFYNVLYFDVWSRTSFGAVFCEADTVAIREERICLRGGGGVWADYADVGTVDGVDELVDGGVDGYIRTVGVLFSK